MTPERIAEIYRELEGMTVALDRSSVRGASYLMDKLQECRRHQDRLLSLTAEIERALSQSKREVRAWKAAILVAGTSAQAPEIRERASRAQDTFDEVRGLEKSLTYARQNMKITDSDIRLAATLVDLQFKIGEVQPPADVPVTTPPPAPPPTAAPIVPPSDLPITEAFQDPRPATPVQASMEIDDISAFLREVK